MRETPNIEDALQKNPSEDEAALGNFTKGGIDFNAKNLDINEQGENIKFNPPVDFKTLETMTIDGITPVIIQIVPISLPMMLGNKTDVSKQRLSMR